MLKQEKIDLFFHIPKTAGSTLRKHIKKNLDKSEYLNTDKLLWREDHIYDHNKATRQLNKYFQRNKDTNLKVIYGHYLPYQIYKFLFRDTRYFTFLRNPESRILSKYNYYSTLYLNEVKTKKTHDRYEKILLINGKMPKFKDWYINRFQKNYIRSMGLIDTYDYIKEHGYDNLNQFYFIGTTETFEEDSLYLYHELGFNKFFMNQNKSKKFHPKLSESEKRMIRKDHKKAFELYEEGKRLNEKFKKENKDFEYIVKDMREKRKLLMPITQTVYDFPELIHKSSAYLRTKSDFYGNTLDYLKTLNK